MISLSLPPSHPLSPSLPPLSLTTNNKCLLAAAASLFANSRERLEMELQQDKKERDTRERELRERRLRELEMREKQEAAILSKHRQFPFTHLHPHPIFYLYPLFPVSLYTVSSLSLSLLNIPIYRLQLNVLMR